MKKDEFENKIVDFLFDNILTGKRLRQFANLANEALSTSSNESPLKKLEQDYNDINRRIDNINRAISEGVWTDSTMSMLRNMTEQSKDLEKKIAVQRISDQKVVSMDRLLFYLHKISEGKRDDREFLHSLITTFINSITVYEDYARVVVNAAENVGTIPPEDLPPIDQLKEFKGFDSQTNSLGDLSTVEPYPVIVFKIAI